MASEVQELLLSQLTADTLRDPRGKTETEADPALVESIKAHGLLQPLVVVPSGKGYAVIAGRRRLASLKVVHKGQKKPTVPCMVRDDLDPETAAAHGLAENVMRKAMDPLAECDAFTNLIDSGVSEDDAARHFGTTITHLRQRRQLANASEKARQAYRDKRLSLDALKLLTAYAPETQDTALDQVRNDRHIHTMDLQVVLRRDWVDASRALFEVDSLPAACISRDLFSEEVRIEAEAFREAQLAHVNDVLIPQLEDAGWDFVHQVDSMDQRYREYENSEFPPPPVYRERADRMDDVAERCQEHAGWWHEEMNLAEDHETVERWVTKAENLHDQANRTLRDGLANDDATRDDRYTAEQKARSGVVLCVDPRGFVSVTKGVVPRGQRPQPNDPAVDGEPANDQPEADPKADWRQWPRKHHRLLATATANAGGAALADTRIAKAFIVYALQCGLGMGNDLRGDFCVRASRSAAIPQMGLSGCALPEYLSWTEAKLDAELTLTVQYLIGPENSESYTNFWSLSRQSVIPHLCQAAGVDLRQIWTPDADFLGAWSKAQLQQLAEDVVDEQFAQELPAKKGDMVGMIAAVFEAAANDGTPPRSIPESLWAEVAERCNQWVPAGLEALEPETPVLSNQRQAAE